MAHIAFANETNVIFSADFNDGYTTEGWATHDANGDGTSWSIDNQLNGYVYNGMNTSEGANDWLSMLHDVPSPLASCVAQPSVV